MKNFHVHSPRFHAKNLEEIFTGRIGFSRPLYKIFSRRGEHFHGWKLQNFHVGKPIFHAEKKNTGRGEVVKSDLTFLLPKFDIDETGGN